MSTKKRKRIFDKYLSNIEDLIEIGGSPFGKPMSNM